MKKQLALALGLPLLATLAFHVAFAADIELGDDCRLAEAIRAANSDEAVGACPAGAGEDSIYLQKDLLLNEALPAISSSIRIEGGGFAIDGGGKRVFHVMPEGDLHIAELTVTGGGADELGSACVEAALEDGDAEAEEPDESRPANMGGAICIDGGMLSIRESVFRGNASLDFGGVILNLGGGVAIHASEFSDNRAEGGGGAIALLGGALEAVDSQFSGNSAGEHGGALYSEGGDIKLSETIFSDNEAADYGGAIDNIAGAALVIVQSAFEGNQATTGGAIGNWQSSVSIAGSLFAANAAENGGAIQSEDGESELCQSELRANMTSGFGAALYIVRGELAAESNELRENSAGEGGIVHIVEPESTTLTLGANSYSDNEGADCLGCADADSEAARCGAELD